MTHATTAASARAQFSIEVCAGGVESCIAAREGGADRVELCADLAEGGITPSYGEIRQAVEEKGRMALHVIIRPRSGDFTYSMHELQRMALDIDAARECGADGVVFGCLDSCGNVDTAACSMLMEHARGMRGITFHRAFDRCCNPLAALQQISKLGFNRILTSGQAATAELGIPLLRQLQEAAAGEVKIMAGCGVNEQNIARIHRETGISEFHFSARVPVVSQAKYMSPGVSMGNKDTDERTLMLTSARRVAATIQALQNAY